MHPATAEPDTLADVLNALGDAPPHLIIWQNLGDATEEDQLDLCGSRGSGRIRRSEPGAIEAQGQRRASDIKTRAVRRNRELDATELRDDEGKLRQSRNRQAGANAWISGKASSSPSSASHTCSSRMPGVSMTSPPPGSGISSRQLVV